MITENLNRISAELENIVEKSYNLGRMSAIEDLELMSDRQWNENKLEEAELLRRAAKELREGE